jgi:hypothetical protein
MLTTWGTGVHFLHKSWRKLFYFQVRIFVIFLPDGENEFTGSISNKLGFDSEGLEGFVCIKFLISMCILKITEKLEFFDEQV